MITVVCPKCKRENTMCICMSNVECYIHIKDIEDDGTLILGYPEINEGDTVAYECYSCGHRLRIKPDPYDEKLIAWAKRQQKRRERNEKA